MQRYSGQQGAGLVLLIGITAALAILSASLVMMVVNQQGATAKERSTKTSMYYGEAALNSAIAALKGTDTWLTGPYSGSAATTAMSADYDTLPSPRPTPTYRVYDDVTVVTTSTPDWDQNDNGRVWIEVAATYQNRTSRVRQMVASVTKSLVERFPKAALFCGGGGADDNLYFRNNGDAYAATYPSWPATNANGVAYVGGAPFPTSVMAQGNITAATGSTNLALGTAGINPQSLGAQANGTATIPGVASLKWTKGGVPDLNSYFSSGDQLKLMKLARSCLEAPVQAQLAAAKVDARPADARPADQRPAAVVPVASPSNTFPNAAALLVASSAYGTYNTTTKVFTANKDLIYSAGNLTLNAAGVTYNFRSLTLTGTRSLTLSGSTTTTFTGGLRVGGAFNVSSTGGTNVFGPVYAVGNTNIGGSKVKQFGALWVDGSLTLSGTGPTTATTLHVGASGMSITSTSAVAHSIGPAYVMGGLTTIVACTSPIAFGDLWVDGSLALNGRGATTTGTLHVGNALTISSTVGANTFASTYAIGAFSTSVGSTSANTFGPLWVDGAATLNGSGTTFTTALHVGGALSINSPAITNTFGPAYVIGDFSTTSTSTSTNRFGPLWADGSVTLNGATTTQATALHVGVDFTISGPTSTNQFGPIHVGHNVTWHGAASVRTTDYTNIATAPGPMWFGGTFVRDGGPFNDVYGNTFVMFKVYFQPTASATASTVMCPLLATTEMITTSGNTDFGTMVVDAFNTKPRPMTLYQMDDQDNLWTQTCNWGNTGQFYGLMVFTEAGIRLTTGNVTKPAVVGSVLSVGGNDGVTVDGNAQVAYNQDVIDAVIGTLTTTTTVTQTVHGTWQELSPSGN